MADSKRQPFDAPLSGDRQGENSGHRELRRLSESFEAQWQDWIGNSVTPETECLHLTELVYALADLQGRAQEMRLDFLGYLLGMTLEEALNLLRAAETRG